MRPARELNSRFQGYLRRQRHVRHLTVAIFGVALISVGIAASASLLPHTKIVSAVPAQAELAAASTSWLHSFGEALFRTLCPIFHDCPPPDAAPQSALPAEQPLRAASTQPTNPPPVPSPPTSPLLPTVIAQASTAQPTIPAQSQPSSAPVVVVPPSTIAQTADPPVQKVTVERIISAGGISESLLNSRLQQLQDKLEGEIQANSIAYSPDIANVYRAISIAGGGGGSTTNVTNVNGVTTFVALTDVPSTLAAGDILYADAANHLASLSPGADGLVLKLVSGFPTWQPDLQGSGGASAWATTTDDLAVYPSNTSQTVLIGTNATSTTGNILEALGDSLFRGALIAYQTVTAPRFVATSTIASQFPYASSTAVSSTELFATNATTTSLAITNVADALLYANANGSVGAVATSSLGLPTFSYLFPSNATTTGLGIYASTTIGSGTQAGGLTINGGATTTGNAYFAGNVGGWHYNAVGTTFCDQCRLRTELCCRGPGIAGHVAIRGHLGWKCGYWHNKSVRKTARRQSARKQRHLHSWQPVVDRLQRI